MLVTRATDGRLQPGLSAFGRRLVDSENTTLPRANAVCCRKQALYVPIIIVAVRRGPVSRGSAREARCPHRQTASLRKPSCVVDLGIDVALARPGAAGGN